MIEIVPNWHPIFVHFTVALLTIAAILHVAALLVSKPELKTQLQTTGQWNLWLGVLISIITVLAGWFAYNSVNHDTASHLVMTQHRNIALVTMGLFVVLAIWSWFGYRKGLAITWLFTILLLIATSVLAVTAWYGGEIVYRHGLGVMSLPESDKHGHAAGEAHDHGTADGHEAEDHEPMRESTTHDDMLGEDHTHDSLSKDPKPAHDHEHGEHTH